MTQNFEEEDAIQASSISTIVYKGLHKIGHTHLFYGNRTL